MLIALIYLQKERRYKLPVVYSLLVYALRAGFMCCMITQILVSFSKTPKKPLVKFPDT